MGYWVRDLPVIDACPADTAGGRAIRSTLAKRRPFGVGSTALAVPSVPDDHVAGKISAAERAGVTVRAVTEAAERIRLIVLADAAERSHPDPAYRVESPRNHHLLEHRLWLAAYAADGTPLMLVVAPVDGELATLRYFRALTDLPVDCGSRYLTLHALEAELAARGVRWLLDTDPPVARERGLEEVQRSVGFRQARVRLRRAATKLAVVAVPAYVGFEPYLERVSALAAF
jgi:hypothetical protein